MLTSNAYVRADELVLGVLAHTDQMPAALPTEGIGAAPIGGAPREVEAAPGEKCPCLVRAAATALCSVLVQYPSVCSAVQYVQYNNIVHCELYNTVPVFKHDLQVITSPLPVYCINTEYAQSINSIHQEKKERCYSRRASGSAVGTSALVVVKPSARKHQFSDGEHAFIYILVF